MGLAMNLAIVCTAFQFYFAVHIFLGVSKVQFLARNAVPLGEKWGLKGAVLGHVMAWFCSFEKIPSFIGFVVF